VCVQVQEFLDPLTVRDECRCQLRCTPVSAADTEKEPARADVVSEDDAFIGVVWEPGLERAGSSTLDATAQPL
jgi:hypothetical protein